MAGLVSGLLDAGLLGGTDARGAAAGRRHGPGAPGRPAGSRLCRRDRVPGRGQPAPPRRDLTARPAAVRRSHVQRRAPARVHHRHRQAHRGVTNTKRGRPVSRRQCRGPVTVPAVQVLRWQGPGSVSAGALSPKEHPVAEFVYEDLLPLADDPTPYRLLTTEGVRVGRGGRAAHVPRGRPRGAAAADRDGDARHRALPAPGAPGPAAPDPRRPRGQRQRPVRRARPAEERQHRRRRRAADVPGHRHRDRHGQARPARARPTARDEEAHRPRRLRRLHPAQPALLADGAAHDVGGEEHRHQPAGPDRALRRHRPGTRRLQVPVHGQGRRLGQQVASSTRRPRRS